MSLKEEIKPYIDGNGLVTPNKYDPSKGIRGSDNGVMFTSEYYILLQKNGELTSQDILNYKGLMIKCITANDYGIMLTRSSNSTDQEGPDDYYGYLAGHAVLNSTGDSDLLLNSGYRHFGVFRNNPNASFWEAFLWRQPQLYTAMLAAANKLRFYHLPFTIITALIIATSCMFRDKKDADGRRLAWLLIQTMGKKSLLCKLASKVWFNRLYKTYPNGMKDVAALYYEPGHPFIKYWVT